MRPTTKRDIMGVSLDENNKNGPNLNDTNDDLVKAAIDGLTQQFEQRLQSLKTEASYIKNKNQQVHAVSMVKIPKNIKNMTIDEFDSVYDCDLLSMVLRIRDNHMANVLQSSDRLEPETPAMTGRSKKAIETPGQTIRKAAGMETNDAEGVLVATVTKQRRGGENGAPPATNFDISVGAGKYISLNEIDTINGLDNEMKLAALDQIMILKNQLGSLEEKLKGRN